MDVLCCSFLHMCKVSYWRFLYCVLCSSAEKQSNNRLLWIHFDPSLMYEWQRCGSSENIYLQHSVMFTTEDRVHSPYHSKPNLPHQQNKSVNAWISYNAKIRQQLQLQLSLIYTKHFFSPVSFEKLETHAWQIITYQNLDENTITWFTEYGDVQQKWLQCKKNLAK